MFVNVINVSMEHSICAAKDVSNAVNKLRQVKGDGSTDAMSDHTIKVLLWRLQWRYMS